MAPNIESTSLRLAGVLHSLSTEHGPSIECSLKRDVVMEPGKTVSDFPLLGQSLFVHFIFLQLDSSQELFE